MPFAVRFSEEVSEETLGISSSTILIGTRRRFGGVGSNEDEELFEEEAGVDSSSTIAMGTRRRCVPSGLAGVTRAGLFFC